MSDSSKRVVYPASCVKNGGFQLWANAVRAKAMSKGHGKAFPPDRLIPSLLAVPLSSAASIAQEFYESEVSNVKRKAKLAEGSGTSAPPPPGFITNATLDQQQAFAGQLYDWTQPIDWLEWTNNDSDDPEIGTKMLLQIYRKYTMLGEDPISQYRAEMQRKQGESETSVELYHRLTRASKSLESAGRHQTFSDVADAFKAAANKAHAQWLSGIQPLVISKEEFEVQLFLHGAFIDDKLKVSGDTSDGIAAFPSHAECSKNRYDSLVSELKELRAAAAAAGRGRGRGGGRYRGNGRGRGGRGNGRNFQNSPCHNCGKLGHWRNECPEKSGDTNDQDSGDHSALSACWVASTSFFTPDVAMETFSESTTTFEPDISDRIHALEKGICTQYFLRDPPVLSPDSFVHNYAYVWDYLLHEFLDPAENPEITDWKFDFSSGTYYTSLIDLSEVRSISSPDPSDFLGDSNFPGSSSPLRSRSSAPVDSFSDLTVTVNDFVLPEIYSTVTDSHPVRYRMPVSRLSHSDRKIITRQNRYRRFQRRQARLLASVYSGDSVSAHGTSVCHVPPSVTSVGIDPDVTFNLQKLSRMFPSGSIRGGMLRGNPIRKDCFISLAARFGTAVPTDFHGVRPSSHAHSKFAFKIARRVSLYWYISQSRRSSQAPSISLRARAAAFTASQQPGRHEATSRSYKRWLVDTGASSHFSAVKSDFSSIQPGSGFVNGISVNIHGSGDTMGSFATDSGDVVSVTFGDTMYVPDLVHRANEGGFLRLLSVSKATRSGCQFIFGSPDGDYIVLPDSGARVPLVRRDGLIWLHSLDTDEHAAPAQSDVVSKVIAHRRLCHLHDDGMRKLAAMRIPGLPSSGMFSPLPFCSSCTLGKSTVADICRDSTRHSDPPLPFHTMAIDIWGPVHQSAIGGYRWVLGSICFRSGYHLAELMKSKSDAPTVWRRMVLKIQSWGHTVTVLRIDNDSVFLGEDFMSVCDEFHISVQRSVPHRHHQLARIERHWRTISDAVTAMLSDSGLPKRFWGYAFITVAFVRNRVWHSGASCIPFMMVHGGKPDLSRLRVFGCPAYVHVEKSSRRKLDPKAWMGVLVGYASDSPCWLVYNPATGNVIRTQNARFDEHWRDSLLASSSLPLGENDGDEESQAEDPAPARGETSSPGESCSPDVVVYHSDDSDDDNSPDAGNWQPPANPSTSTSASSPDTADTTDTASDGTTSDGRHVTFDHTVRSAPDRVGGVVTRSQSRATADTAALESQFHQLLSDITSASSRQSRDEAINKVLTFADDEGIDLDTSDTMDRIAESIPPTDGDSSNSRLCSRSSGNKVTTEDAFSAQTDTKFATEPRTYKQATHPRNPNRAEWKVASDKEIDAQLSNKTWALVRLPPGKFAIGCTWVYKIKRDGEGKIVKFKARLCIRGDMQRDGIDFNETFAPTVKFLTLRVLLALAAHYDLEIEQFDVCTAFLHSPVEEEVYMRQPEGYVKYDTDGTPFVCKLLRSLYGLKQAPRNWNKLVTEWLIDFGFTQCLTDPGAYTITVKGSLFVLCVYVDDCILVGRKSPFISDFKIKFSDRFKIEDLGPASWLLGCTITRDRQKRTICIGQRQLMSDLLDEFGMENCSPLGTPLPAKTLDAVALESPLLDVTKFRYARLVGKLAYASNCTRPDITAAVNFLTRFMSKPTEHTWQLAKRVLRYVKGTIDYSLIYHGSGDPIPTCWQDASFADGPGRRSRTGFVILMCDAAVAWGSRLQVTVCLSTVEAEYVALCAAAQELKYILQLLEGFGIVIHRPVLVHEDNKGCVFLAMNMSTTNKSKHIDIKYHFIRQCIREKKMTVVWCETSQMIADILTKFSLSSSQHLALALKMMGGALASRG